VFSRAEGTPRLGFRDYWIVNLIENVLEVHRDLHALGGPRGRRYRSIQILRPPARVAPLAAPDALIDVAELLPS
jgi:hypothetical protein